ncbi:hypothetical protein EZI54_07375 [Marinobacter halodurans]|uniref:DNA replication terminus site-binding protein n=1 Tax=Marinobacter halodurans TaxID=2528979 RepID=A0ABY1ZQF4_9GAMM|nr:hypothetical protein [Marinobacter halodurans]TBW57472.1 hypothetical protein EZI54_07375 [Marinobacter halodurans]
MDDAAQMVLPLSDLVSDWRDTITDAQREDDDLQMHCKRLLVDLVSAFQSLREAGDQAYACILNDEDLPAKYLEPHPVVGYAARLRAAQAVTEWYFQPGQAATETTIHMAAIATSERTRQAIAQLNEAKSAFQDVVAQLRRSIHVERHERGELYRLLSFALERRPKVLRDNAIGEVVRDILHPRLSLRQAGRAIPLVDRLPTSIRWRWVSDRASDRITPAQALALLEKKVDNPYVERDRQQLLALDPGEPLSIVKNSVSQLRISLVISPRAEDDTPYLYVKSRMPLFYAGDDPGAFRSAPQLIKVPENAPRFERIKKLEDEPFLKTLPVYRYRSVADSEDGMTREAKS